MCLVAAVTSKEQIQHVLKLVGAFPQTLMSFGWNLQDWISSHLGGTCDKIVHVSLSRIHGCRSVPDTLKAIQRNHSLAESSNFPTIWATHGNFSFFIMMGSFSPWKKNKIKYKSKKKTKHRQVSFPVYLAGHQVQAIGNQMEWKTLWERSLPRPSLLQRGNLDRDHILLIPAVAARPAEREGPWRMIHNQQAKFHGLSMQIPWCAHFAVPKKYARGAAFFCQKNTI